MKNKKIIGFSADFEMGGGFSHLPFYAIRENYLNAIFRHNAMPLIMAHYASDDYINIIDGLVITGGAFDVSPELYGDKNIHKTVELKQRRTDFEMDILRLALAQNKPILGICGGEQLLNVALGGTLIQHIPDSVENALPHEQPNPRNEVGHEIRIIEGTLLHKIAGCTELGVNSAHHQAVEKLGDGVVANSFAPDGIIEGIEYPSHKFCLGVQWHPEYMVSSADDDIFKAFLSAIF